MHLEQWTSGRFLDRIGLELGMLPGLHPDLEKQRFPSDQLLASDRLPSAHGKRSGGAGRELSEVVQPVPDRHRVGSLHFPALRPGG